MAMPSHPEWDLAYKDNQLNELIPSNNFYWIPAHLSVVMYLSFAGLQSWGSKRLGVSLKLLAQTRGLLLGLVF